MISNTTFPFQKPRWSIQAVLLLLKELEEQNQKM